MKLGISDWNNGGVQAARNLRLAMHSTRKVECGLDRIILCLGLGIGINTAIFGSA
jgi:hypothetical protein